MKRPFDPTDYDWKPLAHAQKGYAMIQNPPGVEDIVEAAAKEVGGTPYNILLSRVVPGQVIERHTDKAYTKRVHVPLQTNPKAYFITDEPLHMQLGKVYVVDPSKPHSVVNEGDTDRIHLMFDVKEGA